jgi:hypothetical protein
MKEGKEVSFYWMEKAIVLMDFLQVSQNKILHLFHSFSIDFWSFVEHGSSMALALHLDQMDSLDSMEQSRLL